MGLPDDLERLILGKSLEEFLPKIPSLDNTYANLLNRLNSGFALREIGWSEHGLEIFSEEDLESHVHIVGSTREGKSKLLELLCRYNIDRGYACCLIDPSDNGDTCYKVLKYAIKKGYEKILLIDPNDIKLYDKGCRVPVINPLNYNKMASAVSGKILDASRLLWDQAANTDTPRIQRYLPAVIRALHSGEYTMSDVEFLLEKDDAAYLPYRTQIVEHPVFQQRHRRSYAYLKAALGMGNPKPSWWVYEHYQSTVNRLDPFTDPIMKMMFGARTGIDFYKLIKEKYLILVNLDCAGVWGADSLEQKLVGTMVINELIYAIHSLREEQWRGRYYIYIDECGDYSTKAVKNILDKKSKAGISLALSHQGFEGQLSKEIEASVRRGTKIKILFNTADPIDRLKMVQMMFGGDLSDREVMYHLQDTPKQNCWIKNNKLKPYKAKILDLPDIDIPHNVVLDFKKKIYASDFYKSVEDIRAERQKRFAYAKEAPQPVRRVNLAPKTGSNTQVPQRRAGNDRTATGQGNTVLQRGTQDQPDTYNSAESGGDDQDIPVSWNIPVNNPNAGTPPEGRKDKKEQGGVGKGRKGKR